ncbi:hypothetical protein ACJ2A9_03810 [Anaerobacillus sp. MEB173]|uniref:hypothetical protein n=1 Tax=Anaerobacillus sp. MEB173 TaxID=3383345 RepID=UPI003F929AFA
MSKKKKKKNKTTDLNQINTEPFIDLFVSNVFDKNNVKSKLKPLSKQQKQEIKATVNEIKEHVNTFLKNQSKVQTENNSQESTSNENAVTESTTQNVENENTTRTASVVSNNDPSKIKFFHHLNK